MNEQTIMKKTFNFDEINFDKICLYTEVNRSFNLCVARIAWSNYSGLSFQIHEQDEFEPVCVDFLRPVFKNCLNKNINYFDIDAVKIVIKYDSLKSVPSDTVFDKAILDFFTQTGVKLTYSNCIDEKTIDISVAAD